MTRRSSAREADRDRAIDLTSIPFLTTARVCILAGCHPSTVRRSTLRPVGKRGRVNVYATADVLAWISGGTPAAAPSSSAPSRPRATRAPIRRAASSSPGATTSNAEAIARLRVIVGGKR